MSLYEILDGFVGAGALACAALVGAELPEGAVLDGKALSARLRDRQLHEAFGTVLDGLAHVVWFARERQGIPLETAEQHATRISALLGEVRLSAIELADAFSPSRPAGRRAGAQLAEIWLAKAAAAGAIGRAGLDGEICRFLLAEMFSQLVDQPRVMSGFTPALLDYRIAAMQPRSLPAPATEPPRGVPPANVLVLPGGPPPAAPVTQPAATVQTTPRHKLPDGALKRFQAILAQQPMSAEQRAARLDELGGWLVSTVSHLRKPVNEAAALRQAKLDAASALETGDLERAMERLKAVREHMRDERRRTETRIAEEMQALRTQMADEAGATARLGELALARMDLLAAADHFADAAGQLPATEKALELEYRQKQAEALATRAEMTGDLRAVEAAVLAYRACRRLVLTDTDGRTRVRINVGLGDMLVALGVRTATDTIGLEEAIAAYGDAVAAIDRSTKPMQWALVQLSHGAALIDLGQRRDRDQFWRQAATVLMPALDVFESRGASDLAEAARAKLRGIAAGLAQPPAAGLLDRPLRAG